MSTSDSSGSPRLVASFPDAESARGAMIDLEAIGLDAEAVRLIDRAPARDGAAARSGDLQATGAVATNYIKGAIGTAVALGVIAAVVVLALGLRPRPLAVGLALLGGAVAGFFLGGFINAARRLPVNADALETFGMDEGGDRGPVRVEVQVQDAGMAERIESVCREHSASDVQRTRS